jgi:hypothetical protein
MSGYPPMLTETLITPSTMATFIYTQKSHMFGKYLHIACFSHHFPEPSFLKSFYMCVCVCVCVCVFAVSRAHTWAKSFSICHSESDLCTVKTWHSYTIDFCKPWMRKLSHLQKMSETTDHTESGKLFYLSNKFP